MFTLSSDVLSMTGEAAALLQNHRLVYANAAARAILGEDCVGKSVRALFGDEIAEIQAPNFVASLPVDGRSRLLRFCRDGGNQLVFLSRPDPDGELLNDACLQALRSSLMNMSLALGAARQTAGDGCGEALRRQLGALTREYYRLNRLLSNLSAARGILRGDLPVTLGAVDLGAMIADLTDSLSLLRPDVSFGFVCEKRTLLWADAQLLELMTLNLLSNCLTHAAGLQRVQIDLRVLGDRVYLTVRDDGTGIPPEKMNSLFHRWHADLRMRELSDGAGLGMSVIRGIAEAHGGALMLESREGAGTMVRLSLSRLLGGETQLREEPGPYVGSMERLLTGLADCLPDACFDRRYLD